jgi:hypothetical protein
MTLGIYRQQTGGNATRADAGHFSPFFLKGAGSLGVDAGSRGAA